MSYAFQIWTQNVWQGIKLNDCGYRTPHSHSRVQMAPIVLKCFILSLKSQWQTERNHEHLHRYPSLQ